MTSSIHNQRITNDCWIYIALVFLVSCVLGVMLCSSDQIITGQVVMDSTDNLHYYSTEISASLLVSSYC